MQNGEHTIDKIKEIHSIENKIAVYFNGACHHAEKQQLTPKVDTVLVAHNKVQGVVQNREIDADIPGGARQNWWKIKNRTSTRLELEDTWDKIYFDGSNLNNHDLEEGDWVKTGRDQIIGVVKNK